MNRRGTTLKGFLKNQLKDPAFRKAYRDTGLSAKLAVRIASLREERGLTQLALARKLKISQQALSSLEDPSSANYTLGTLQRIATALKKDLVVELR